MKSKKLVVSLLVMLAVVMSTLTFAYWASGVTGSDQTATATIAIGEGDAVSTSVVVGNQTNAGELVPSGYEDDSATFDNVSLTFSVNWSGTGAEGTVGSLAVTADSFMVGANDVSGLFSMSVTSGDGAITAGSAQSVVINVSFDTEPATEALYDAIANGSLVVTLSFDVTVA